MSDIGCLCGLVLYIFLTSSVISNMDPVVIFYTVVGWGLACALMYWAVAYRDIGVARASAIGGRLPEEDEEEDS